MTTLQILTVLNMALELAANAGLNIQKLQALRAKAKAEGREISHADLQGLADDAQAAIDRL